MRDYQVGIIENCAKMRLFYTILGESLQVGDRMLLFSQSLLTLDLIEEYLKRTTIPCLGRSWTKNHDYYSKYNLIIILVNFHLASTIFKDSMGKQVP